MKLLPKIILKVISHIQKTMTGKKSDGAQRKNF
jgi:hypothetical protein